MQWAASARVDGIPLYAPSAGTIGSLGLPDEGFEVLLPRVEGFAANVDAVVEAAHRADWDRVRAALLAVPLEFQSSNLGKYAAILGEDAYTALGHKRDYLSGMKALTSALTGATSGNEKEAERAVKAAELMQSSMRSLLDLVPPIIVSQVRAREKALADAVPRDEKAAREKAEEARMADLIEKAKANYDSINDEFDQMGG
jgi:hypothetical protein